MPDDKIKERLKKYLERDEIGTRKAVLRLFLKGSDEAYTTEDIYNYLSEQKFKVNYRGISAMVGLMNTKLGILSVDVTGAHNVYTLKDGYKELVASVLENY
jgi:Fe2+ or Zn2+ uptake regulation protein